MNDSEVLVRQKHLHMGFFASVLMIITTLQWINLDMYLPALPVLKEEYHTTEAMLNISMNAGIIGAAIATVCSGVLSDRYGRKPILLTGLAISAAGNFLCAFTGGIVMLSLLRGFAGFGSGLAEVVTAAMLKDSFSGRSFERYTTLMQSIAAVGPLFAPTLGSLIINYSSWHGVFFFLCFSSILSGLPILISTETWPPERRFAGNLAGTAKEAIAIAKAPSFLLLLGINAFLTIPVWAFVSVSPYVFINEFGLANTTYGILYGVASAMSFLAPFLYLFLLRRTGAAMTVRITIAMTLAGGLAIIAGGNLHPAFYLLPVVPIMLSEGMIRPLSIVILLDEYRHAAGSASSLMHLSTNLVGIVGTTLATLPWHSLAKGTGIISLCCGLAALVCWVSIRCKGLLAGRF